MSADGRAEAIDVFRTVVARDRPLFAALRALVEAGKALTILLGNHGDRARARPRWKVDVLEEEWVYTYPKWKLERC